MKKEVIEILKKEVNLSKTPIYNSNSNTFYRGFNFDREDIAYKYEPALIWELETNLYFFKKFGIYADEIYIPKRKHSNFNVMIFDRDSIENISISDDEIDYKYNSHQEMFDEYIKYCEERLENDAGLIESMRNEDEYYIDSFDYFYELFIEPELDDFFKDMSASEIVEYLVKDVEKDWI